MCDIMYFFYLCSKANQIVKMCRFQGMSCYGITGNLHNLFKILFHAAGLNF